MLNTYNDKLARELEVMTNIPLAVVKHVLVGYIGNFHNPSNKLGKTPLKLVQTQLQCAVHDRNTKAQKKCKAIKILFQG